MINKKVYRAMPFLNNDLRIVLIGCGGTGSLVLHGLATIAITLFRTGRESRIHVIAYDGDTVSEANIGRQPFTPAEIGQNKAVCLVNQINQRFGLDWEAEPRHFSEDIDIPYHSVVIGCVDSRRSRREIQTSLYAMREGYYIDCGNDRHSGQVIIGCHSSKRQYELPMPWEVCPSLVSEEPEDNTPSCSLAEALNSQDLLVNRFAADITFELVWQLLKFNKLETLGAFYDCRKLKMIPIPIKPQKDMSK